MLREPTEERTDRDFILGLKKGLAVIECFDDEHERLTSADVAVKTGLSRAAARRCLLTLHKLGYVHYDGKLFMLAPRILRLGYAYILSASLPQLFQPFLEHLSEQIHESCSAAILEGDEIVYLARAATKRIMSTGLCIGTRLPSYCTSMGRVLLASLEPDQMTTRLGGMERRRLTPFTRTRLDDLVAILDEVRTDGYCVVDQELEVGLISISVPAFNNAGGIAAAMNVASSSSRVTAEQMVERFLPALLDIQKELRPLIRP
ncbi:MAG: IclR family transcriptional regulator C-terminal domain-containing protein [Rhodomicrobiaceae bacterium]